MVCLTKVLRPVAGFAMVCGLFAFSEAAFADPTTDPTSAPVVDPNAGFSSPEGGGDIFGDASGPMDLIHRAVLMNDMSLADFNRQQHGRLAEEAANFRQLQQEAIQRQMSSSQAEETGEPVPEE
jgi:hypothetical protein